ncbi:hypothetical protein PBAL39_15569 [Pedobacter sp. BAL39]|nr:hypothetical protein PBAL39_15569 [Pedobacter sp. BAL39]
MVIADLISVLNLAFFKAEVVFQSSNNPGAGEVFGKNWSSINSDLAMLI